MQRERRQRERKNKESEGHPTKRERKERSRMDTCRPRAPWWSSAFSTSGPSGSCDCLPRGAVPSPPPPPSVLSARPYLRKRWRRVLRRGETSWMLQLPSHGQLIEDARVRLVTREGRTLLSCRFQSPRLHRRLLPGKEKIGQGGGGGVHERTEGRNSGRRALS